MKPDRKQGRKQKELPPTESQEELAPYEAPTVTTYREADILAELGDANATGLFSPLLS